MKKLNTGTKATLETKYDEGEVSEVVKVQEMDHLQQVTSYEHETTPAVRYWFSWRNKKESVDFISVVEATRLSQGVK